MLTGGAPEEVLTGRAVADLYDFNDAAFSSRLGGIELRGDGRRGRVYVVAGMGSGALVYRMLAKRGFSVATGILHTNDLDYYVARSLGAECTAQAPMEAPQPETVTEASELLNDCDAVIDCGFDVGPLNLGNVALLETALKSGKTVLTLRDNGSEMRLDAASEASWVRCGDIARLLDELDRRVPSNAETQHTNEIAPEL